MTTQNREAAVAALAEALHWYGTIVFEYHDTRACPGPEQHEAQARDLLDRSAIVPATQDGDAFTERLARAIPANLVAYGKHVEQEDLAQFIAAAMREEG